MIIGARESLIIEARKSLIIGARECSMTGESGSVELLEGGFYYLS